MGRSCTDRDNTTVFSDTVETMQPQPSAARRPDSTEHDPYYSRYIDLVGDGPIVPILEAQLVETLGLLSDLTEAQAASAYAPGKWTLKQVLGHVIDTERIFAYRVLRIARNDATPIEGFDQDPYVEFGPFTNLKLAALLDEFRAVRNSTILLLRHLNPEAWTRRGIANGKEVTVRALAYTVAGHELHHRRIIASRYLNG